MQQTNNSGEEAVYSSDGLEPLSIPNLPLNTLETSRRDSLNKEEEMEADEYNFHPSIDARQAFEMFQGKLYKPLDHFEAVKYLGRDTVTRESMLDKLTRLNAEVKEMEADLTKIPTASSSVNRKLDTESIAATQIKESVKDLSARLAALSSTMGVSARSKVKIQKDLTSLIKNEVIKLSSSSTTNSAPSPTKVPSSSTSTSKVVSMSTPGKNVSQTSSSAISSNNSLQQNTAQQNHGIVYELYASIPGVAISENPSIRNNELVSSDLIGNESIESLEKRLNRIENFVGQYTGMGSPILGAAVIRGTLLQRIIDLEQKIHRIDDKSLQTAATRAKVIRADLEAAAKARNKLNVSLSNSSEDPKIISRLHEQLLELDGFFSSSSSNVLTAIVQRLSICANLHSKAMTFESRLIELERMAKDMNQLVQNVEECLNRVETGMVVNLKVMEQNMIALDDRSKSLR